MESRRDALSVNWFKNKDEQGFIVTLSIQAIFIRLNENIGFVAVSLNVAVPVYTVVTPSDYSELKCVSKVQVLSFRVP